MNHKTLIFKCFQIAVLAIFVNDWTNSGPICKLHWIIPFSKMSHLHGQRSWWSDMEDTQHKRLKLIFVEGICGQEINWGCQFLEVSQCFGMSGSLKTKSVRDWKFCEKEGRAEQTSQTMGPERKKERKNKRMQQSPNSCHKNQRWPGDLPVKIN